eukprot:TRINITY_DN13531_c0_g1_i1.p1 TRINITY_DN13531_c0_g1~~TRINITY_DN13531_c0_g1_i1.p1  ORF type:complete len:522 (+),score=43.00 TRINITY_DN13531_c0_g1_i1:56-1621(+)
MKIQKVVDLLREYEELSDDEKTTLLGNNNNDKPTKRRSTKESSTYLDDSNAPWGSYKQESMRLSSPSSWAIPVGYFSVGVVQTLFLTPLTFYLVKDRNTPSDKISMIATVASLPWCLKTIHGVITDCYPIRNEHRRPWFVIGWAGYTLLSLYLSMYVDTMTVPTILAFVFLQHMCFVMGDVTADSLVVERSKLIETDGHHGDMQSTCYLLRFTGGMIGSTCGAYSHMTMGSVFLLSAGFGSVPVIFATKLKETIGHSEIKRGLRSEYHAILNTLSQEAVYKPMFFIFFYNIMQWGNAAWPNFLLEGLSFSESDLGIITVAGSVMNWLGVAMYKQRMSNMSWRTIYYVTSAVSFVFSIMQVVLILRWNRTVGVSDLVFALGDNSVAVFVAAIQFLPTVIMYISMCPAGAEGSVYALLTTMSNLSGVCGGNITTLLAAMWPYDISNSAFRKGDFTGMLYLSIFTSLVNPIPLVFASFLPASHDEQQVLKTEGTFSPFHGRICFSLVLLAVLWTFTQNTILAFA